MKWYEMNEEERVKNVYSKYTIKDFWKWWSDDQYYFMEVRILDYKKKRFIAEKYNLPFSKSGVYIRDEHELKAVIMSLRKNENMWFGIQPRKKNFIKENFKVFGGGDDFVLAINYLFLDIDRDVKDGVAKKDDLKNCDEVANSILDKLGKENWNKSYMKICSGHGLQLLIKLDIPIKIPFRKFNVEFNRYESNDNFEDIKKIVKEGIGKQILMFVKNQKMGVCIDKNVFDLGRVGALPFTKNFKYDTSRWRGIIEIKNEGRNEGITDYIMSLKTSKPDFFSKDVFDVGIPGYSDIIRKGGLRKNKLVRFMLTNNLPEGERNNYLWMSVKALLRDSNYDVNCNEFKRVHMELEKRHGTLTLNFPDKKYKFKRDIINKWFINNLIPPIYELWPDRNINSYFFNNEVEWEERWYNKDVVEDKYQLEDDTDIVGDMRKIREEFKPNDSENNIKLGKFITSCLNKYGEKATRYYFTYLFPEYFR